MSLVVQMDGLPANADANAVVLAVRKILQKLKIRFWVHDFGFSPETNTKKCKIEFFAKHEATKAIDKITSKPQTIIGVPCNLKITFISDIDKGEKKGDPESRRDRSRSPISKEEANINKELEQLKKEKEELEKRKSELLKKKMNIDQKETKEEDTASKDMMKHTKIQHTILPKCTAAEISIMEQMKPLARPYIQKRYYQTFMQRMHVEIRTRLAILMETGRLKKTLPIQDIVKAYRWKHPEEKDPEMIEYILSQIKLAFWAYRAKNKDGTNTEPYEYDESEEEDDASIKEKGDVTNDNQIDGTTNTEETTNNETNATETAEDNEENDYVYEDNNDWIEEGNEVAEVAS
ncbi:hypothetical protein O3G_MSEX015306 [Manduca sexta]|uniref:Uncharacterized protein n=1 Tax=Manduca sexta TaxID=7130 RepID=A0A921ZYJ7_MANSE|nr:hypothetical protein O3G_MSEX015306 [Manduca sexta]